MDTRCFLSHVTRCVSTPYARVYCTSFNRHTTRENDICCVEQIHTLRPTRRGPNVTKVMLKTSRVTGRRVQSYNPWFSALLLGVSIACSSPILQSKWPINSILTAVHVSVASRDYLLTRLGSHGSRPVEYSESLVSLRHAALQVGRHVNQPAARIFIDSFRYLLCLDVVTRLLAATPYLLMAAYPEQCYRNSSSSCHDTNREHGGNSIFFIFPIGTLIVLHQVVHLGGSDLPLCWHCSPTWEPLRWHFSKHT